MRYGSSWIAIGVATAVAALVGCSGTSTMVSPETQVMMNEIGNDVAASTGQAVVSDVDETGNDAGSDGSYARTLPGSISASIAKGVGGSACSETGAPSDLRYYCKPDTLTITNSAGSRVDTLIRQRNFEYFAQGTAQAAPDTMTDSINFGGSTGVTVYASIHRARWSGVSHRVRNHSVTDHPSFARDAAQRSTWNGSTLATDTAAYTGSVWTVNITGVAYDTTANVTFQRPRGQNPFPLSGEFHRWATWQYSAAGPSERSGTVSRHIVVTYNGTDTAQLQVLGATTLTCDLNLVTGDVSTCH